MRSLYCERAIADALHHGHALLKFISPNDAGVTGSHQAGFYLPVGAWEMFTTQEPTDGINHKHLVRIVWQDGTETESAVTWYGKDTRHEYRLTRFGRDFPFLNADAVGNLLVLVPETIDHFRAYVLDLEEDIDDIISTLGVDVLNRWGVYQHDAPRVENENDCVERHFRQFAGMLEEFPPGDAFSRATRDALVDCVRAYSKATSDQQLLKLIEAEYRLFRLVERRLCEPQIHRMFATVDEFLQIAGSIMNRRKSRAGRAFENHFGFLLESAGVPFKPRPAIDGRPDIVIPSEDAYNDPAYPIDRLFVVGLKTTCKDRWRQVLNEGTRVSNRHLVTLQQGISTNQLVEMAEARLTLVVPDKLHHMYPTDSPIHLQSVSDFIEQVQRSLTA